MQPVSSFVIRPQLALGTNGYRPPGMGQPQTAFLPDARHRNRHEHTQKTGLARFGQKTAPLSEEDYRQYLGQQVLIRRGDITPDFVDAIVHHLSRFPRQDIEVLKNGKCRFIASATVQEGVPEYRGRHTEASVNNITEKYYTNVGLFHYPSGSIVFAQYYEHPKTGERHLNPELETTVAEEVSHAIDFIYGNVSDLDAVKNALHMDLENLSPKEKQQISEKWNIPADELDDREFRGEIFACLYGTYRQGRTHDRGLPVLEKFPNLLRFITQDFIPGQGTRYKPIQTSFSVRILVK